MILGALGFFLGVFVVVLCAALVEHRRAKRLKLTAWGEEARRAR